MAHAEADLEGTRRTATEHLVEIAQAILQLQTELRPALIEAALLAFSHAPGTHHETLDRAMLGGVFSRLRLLLQFSHAVLLKCFYDFAS